MPRVAKEKTSTAKTDSTANLGFEAKLWLTADKLRNNMDAAEPSGARQPARQGSPKGQRGGAEQYKHVVLGLIFLSRAERDRSRASVTRRASRGLRVKYISDSFEEHQARGRTKAEGGMKKDYIREEGRKRPEGAHQTVCAANHPHVRKPAKIHGCSGAGQITAPLGNIRRGELSGSPSRKEQSRVHRQMRRLAPGTGRAERSETDWLTSQPAGDARRRGSIRLLAGTPRRWRNRASGQAAIPASRVRRTDRHLRHDHQKGPRGRKSEGSIRKEDSIPLPHSSLLLPTFPVLANGSMSSNQSGDCPARSASSTPKAKPQSLPRQRDIRKALIEADLVDTAVRDSAILQREATPQVLSKAKNNMVALPGQLFYSTQIPVCLWFLAKDKSGKSPPARRSPQGEVRDRRQQTLFIDARKLGTLIGAGMGNPSVN